MKTVVVEGNEIPPLKFHNIAVQPRIRTRVSAGARVMVRVRVRVMVMVMVRGCIRSRVGPLH